MTWLSLIKSWSTWDLARFAPEQANHLDWFCERDEGIKWLTAIRRVLLFLLACFLAWSEEDNGKGGVVGFL